MLDVKDAEALKVPIALFPSKDEPLDVVRTLSQLTHLDHASHLCSMSRLSRPLARSPSRPHLARLDRMQLQLDAHKVKDAGSSWAGTGRA